MLSGFFTKTSAGVQLVKNFGAINKTPKNYRQLVQNQKSRYQSILDAKARWETTSAKDTTATKAFWAMQTVVFLRFIKRHAKVLEETFGLPVKKMNHSKHDYVLLLSLLIDLLQNGSNEKRSQLIDLVIQDNAANLAGNVNPSTEKPILFTQRKNSIEFAAEQIAAGKRVVIMDAGNAQRPGAGGYEQGTFQEALTRSSDLYWKVLAHFRNVYSETEKENLSVAIPENEMNIDVLSFQCRYLSLILNFVKESIKDPNYFSQPSFREDFFKFADSIYGEMENKVFEIPFDSGFLKNCEFFNVQDVKTSDDLFKSNTITERCIGRGYVIEVAAPDKRELESRYDLSSAIDRRRQQSNQDSLADQMILGSINFTLQQAIDTQADTIILNAYGCGAFKNKPSHVADIFADALAKKSESLKGKTIYFMDLNPQATHQFAEIFCKRLNALFNINPIAINDCQVNINFTKFDTQLAQKECIVFPTNSKRFKMTGIEAGLRNINEHNVIRIEETEFKGQPKNFITLKKIYSKLLTSIAEKNAFDIIHFPLLGTGNLKFHPLDSLQALIESIEEISIQHPQLKSKQIYIHVVDEEKDNQTKFKLVNNWLWNKKNLREDLEAEKYYTISFPDSHRKKAFAGGVAMTEVRTLFTTTWNVWNTIRPGLVLGKIPTAKEAAILKHNKLKNLGLVISAVEDFELAGLGISYFSDPIQKPSQWKEIGVRNHQVMVQDIICSDFPDFQIIRAVSEALQTIEKGEAVYVHCKAGRSRSATIVFLIEYFLQLKENQGVIPDKVQIYHKIKEARQEISLSSVHFELIDRIIKMHDARPELFKPAPLFCQTPEFDNTQDLPTQINTYLGSHRGKCDMMQLSQFKELKIHELQHPNKKQPMQLFLNEIYRATDGSWINKLDQLQNEHHFPTEKFVNELVALVATQIGRPEIDVKECFGLKNSLSLLLRG